MKYIQLTPNPSGAYPGPQSRYFPGSMPLTDEQAAILVSHNGFVTITPEPDKDIKGSAVTVTVNTEAWEAWKAQQPTKPDPLEEAKAAKIAQSKTDLAAYLEAHPIQWTDGEYYSITAEKQQQLTGKIMAATLAAQTSTPYTLTWNSTGEVCKEWTLTDLSALAFAIDKQVTALVTYQQTQEVAMREAETLEELEAIVVDYDSVEAAA